jgi:hypothetical protein
MILVTSINFAANLCSLSHHLSIFITVHLSYCTCKGVLSPLVLEWLRSFFRIHLVCTIVRALLIYSFTPYWPVNDNE